MFVIGNNSQSTYLTLMNNDLSTQILFESYKTFSHFQDKI